MMISQRKDDDSSRNKPTASTEDELLSDIERLTKRVADIGQNATPFKAAGGAPSPPLPPARRTPLSAEEEARLRDLSDEGDLDAVSALLERRLLNPDACDFLGNTALHRCSAAGHASVAEALLGHGASAHAKNYMGARPLHEAASGGHTECVEALLAEEPRGGRQGNARAGGGDDDAETQMLVDATDSCESFS